MINQTKVRAARSWPGDGVDLLIMVTSSDEDGNTVKSVGENIVMRQVQEQERLQPTMSLEYEGAQYLMDQLWDCGLRPSEGTGSAGAMAATQKHLEDMRRLVFDGRKDS